jgi:hypothetical protein
MKNNSVKQIRVCLEEVAKIINDFIEEIIEDFKLREAYKNGEEVEIQYRGIGLKGDFHEDIRRSDDEIIYILHQDKTVGMIIERRTSFNNAEMTLIKTSRRKFKKLKNLKI